MRHFFLTGLQGAGLSALLLSPPLFAGQPAPVTVTVPPPADALMAELKRMQHQLADQQKQIEALAREVEAQRRQLQEPAAGPDAVAAEPAAAGEPGARAARPVDTAASDALSARPADAAASDALAARPAATTTPNALAARPEAAAGADALAAARGTGPVDIDAAEPGAAEAQPQDQPGARNQAKQQTKPQAQSRAQAQAAPTGAVGRPPARNSRPPEVAPLFEQPGVLTPKSKFVIEPALQFGYSSSNRVALVGYTIIPALLIGLIDVREVKRNTLTGALTVRTGLSNRFEIEARLPYVYRSDATVSRELFTGTAVEKVFDTSGKHAGDAELAVRYQLNNGGADRAYYIGGLRFKSRTGRDPFDVITDCTRRCVGENATGTGLPLDLPTGSGFYSLQPGLTWLYPSDPAVFFGSINYTRNFQRSGVSRTVLNGEKEFLGDVKPGDVIGFNFGIGLALNEKAALSLGYDHSSIARTRQNGIPVPGAVRTQLGTLLLGYSYRISDKRTVNVSVGAGLTRDTPDVTLTLRLPTTF